MSKKLIDLAPMLFKTIGGEIIDYTVCIGSEHYGPKLYDYEAYKVKKYI